MRGKHKSSGYKVTDRESILKSAHLLVIVQRQICENIEYFHPFAGSIRDRWNFVDLLAQKCMDFGNKKNTSTQLLYKSPRANSYLSARGQLYAPYRARVNESRVVQESYYFAAT